MRNARNVFEAICRDGHDEFFSPKENEEFVPTNAAPGSREKIKLLRQRVTQGVPLWHESDRCDYTDLTAVIPPRYC